MLNQDKKNLDGSGSFIANNSDNFKNDPRTQNNHEHGKYIF